MRIEKWVELSDTVQVDVDVNDVRGALAEAFANVTEDRLGEERPKAADVMRCFALIGKFLLAVTDDQIAMLNDAQRRLIGNYLANQSLRYVQPACAWRPISEMHEDFGTCILINLADPGYMVLGNNCSTGYNEKDWTHFAQVPSLTHEDARRLSSKG